MAGMPSTAPDRDLTPRESTTISRSYAVHHLLRVHFVRTGRCVEGPTLVVRTTHVPLVIFESFAPTTVILRNICHSRSTNMVGAEILY